MSGETIKLIDSEVRRFVEQGLERARKILKDAQVLGQVALFAR